MKALWLVLIVSFLVFGCSADTVPDLSKFDRKTICRDRISDPPRAVLEHYRMSNDKDKHWREVEYVDIITVFKTGSQFMEHHAPGRNPATRWFIKSSDRTELVRAGHGKMTEVLREQLPSEYLNQGSFRCK